ncbi:MAG: hypothetical protein U1E76_09085 [Planctomycetota bacterium]
MIRPANAKACAGRLEDIHRLIDRQLSPRVQAAVRDHLRSCAGCESYHRTMEQVVAGTRALLKNSAEVLPPKFNAIRTAALKELERHLRSDACGHLVDMVRVLLVGDHAPPIHLTLPANALLTSVRRLRDLVQERKQWNESRRYIRGPWSALSAFVERQLHGDAREPPELDDLVRMAIEFSPEDGAVRLAAAAVARVQQDGAALGAHLEVAAVDSNPKVRALAHVNLASTLAYAGQFEEALRQLRVAQVYDDGSPWLPYGHALFSFATGATRELKKHLQALAETIQRSRRADELRNACHRFLPSDVGYLAEAHGLSAVAQAHFRHMAVQVLPPASEVKEPRRTWPCRGTLALFDLG